MRVSKCMLAVGVLTCVIAQNLNAMPFTRPVSRVSSAIVSEIRSALTSNKLELVLQLLSDNGLSINSQLTNNETVLHLIAKLGKHEIAEKFLAMQTNTGLRLAKVNIRDRKGKTPLAYAQANGHTDLANLLQTYIQQELAALQNIERPRDLFTAAANNDRAGAELLLAEGANPSETRHHGKINRNNQLGFKIPFHVALEAKHYSLAALLLKEAQGINGIDEKGWTPLMFAILARDWDMVRELIVDGADIFAGYHRSSNFYNQSSSIKNALDVAQRMKSEAQLVDIFVEEKGADGVIHTYGETWPFIMLASEGGYTETVKQLREQGAKFDGEKAMLLAMRRNNLQQVIDLIEDETKLIDVFIAANGVDGRIGKGRNTLLMLAAKGGHTKIVELLIARHADVNRRNKNGKTAAMLAKKGGHTKIVELLIARHADIVKNKNDETDMTSLVEAVVNVRTETAAPLLDLYWDRVRKLLKDDKDIFSSGLQVLRVVRVTGSEAQLVDLLVEGGVRSVHRALKFAKQRLPTRWDREMNDELLKLMHEKLSEMLEPPVEKTAEPMAQDLWQAVTNNDRPSVEHLLAEGANAKEKDAAGKTALDIAISANHYALAAILLRATKGVNGMDDKGWTPLSWALVSGDKDLVQDLLKDGAKPSKLSHDAIEIAMRVQKKEILALMVGMGTEDIFDYFGRALRGVIYNGDLQQLKILLETRVEPSVATVRGKIGLVHGTNSSHGTLLHMAANVSWQRAKADYIGGEKVGGGRKAIMEYLLTNTAIDINALDGDGRTALQVVVDGYDNDNSISVFDALMAKHSELVAAGENGIDLDNRDNKGETALDIASDSFEGKHHFVTNLSKATADLKVRKPIGQASSLFAKKRRRSR